MSTVPAGAITCGGATGYDYSGEADTTTNLEGLQGELGKADPQDLNGAAHIINYYDVSDDQSSCGGLGSCWVQGGEGHGIVGNQAAPDGQHAYYESNDINGYEVNWKDTSDVAGSTHSAYISITLVASSNGNHEYEIDSYTTGGEFKLGPDSWFHHLNLDGFVQSEAEYFTSGSTCVAFHGPVYYGANASGGFSSDTLIESSPGGTTFSHIGDTNWHVHGPGGNLTYSQLNGHRSSFKAND